MFSEILFLQETYPCGKPMWYSESDDKNVVQVMEELADFDTKSNYKVMQRISILSLLLANLNSPC